MRVGPQVVLTDEQRTELTRLSRGRTTQARVVQRAKIVLHAADGLEDLQIAQRLDCNPQTARRWRRRFLAQGVEGLLKDRPRGGRPAAKRDAVAGAIVRLTTQEHPQEATHWSSAIMAKRVGASRRPCFASGEPTG